MRHALPHLLVAAAALVAASPVYAHSHGQVRTVSYADLDLSNAAGRAALKQRIDRAVDRVCAVEGDRSLAMAMASRRCVAETHERTRSAVEVAMLKGDTRLASVATGLGVTAR
jgi:UrcA family protein